MVIKIAVNIKVWILGVINSIDDSAEQSACYEVRRGGDGRGGRRLEEWKERG
jgi:hypothetical protein